MGAGLTLDERPLLVFPEDTPSPVAAARTVPDGVTVRTLTAVVTPHLGFAEPGTAVGPAGVAELAEAVRTYPADIARTAGRIRTGRTTLVAAVEDGAALSSGLLPGTAAGTTEICAIATLPSARRRGLATAVTASLTTQARALGLRTIFLCASDDTVARLYTRLGFRRTATFMEGRGSSPGGHP